MRKYDIIDHTADIGIRAYGRTRKELFANAATGMFELIADLNSVTAKETLLFNLNASSLEDLFILWLEELLYKFDTKRIIFKKFQIRQLSNNGLTAEALGERLNQAKHILHREIKAVTYHNLQVKRINKLGCGSVIFDI